MDEARQSDDSAAKPPAGAPPSLPSPCERAGSAGTAAAPQESASPAASPSPSPRRRNRRKNARRSSSSSAPSDAMDACVTEEAVATATELPELPSVVAQAESSPAVDALSQDAAAVAEDDEQAAAEQDTAAESEATADVPALEPKAVADATAFNPEAVTEVAALEQSVEAQEDEATLVDAAPGEDEQREDQAPRSAPCSPSPSPESDSASEAVTNAVEPDELHAPAAQESRAELSLALPPPPVSTPADETEIAESSDEAEAAEELDEAVDDEDNYTEPADSPSPSPPPSPDRDERSTTDAGQPSLDVEATSSTETPLVVAHQDAEDIRLEASFPLPISMDGPGRSTAEDVSEMPMSNLIAPVRDDGQGSNGEPLSDREQGPDCVPRPQVGLDSPGPDEVANSSKTQVPSFTQSTGAPQSGHALPLSSPEAGPGSLSVAGDETIPSSSSTIAAPRSKKSITVSPPPAPIAAKKPATAATARPTATRSATGPRVPASKTSAVAKLATKPSSAGTAKALKPNAVAATAKAENVKKAVPTKSVTTKKSAPKAVVYSVSPAPRTKRAAPVPTASKPSKEAVITTEGVGKSETTGLDQDGAKVHPKRVTKARSEAASNRLYEDAKASKMRKEARSAEVDEACTFVPKVSHAAAATSKRPSLGETDRFVALHEEAKQLQAKKQELQRKHEEATCTFRPTITSKAKKLARETARPRYENLYMQAREIKQKREEKALAKKKEDEEECSFKPKIKATKSPVQTKPLYDAERDKLKQLQLEQKRREAELSECTFRPKVLSKKPSGKAEAGDAAADEGEIYDRLYRAGKVQAERIERLRKEREDEEKAKAPFQPKLATAAHKTKDGDAQQKEPFHKRLFKKDHVQKLGAEREQQKLEEERRFSYKPKISEMPEEIKAKQKEYTSPDKPVFERLYEEKERIKEKLQAGEEARAQKEMAECTFRPRVASPNVSSNGSAPTSPVWERLSICHKSQAIEEREKLKQQLEMQECTFKPVISPSDHVSPYRSPSYLARRRSSQGESCSPSFDAVTRKASVKAPRSSPNSRSTLAQFQPVSIENILKSSTLVLSEETASSQTSAPGSTAKEDYGPFALGADGADSSTVDSRRPSPVRKPNDMEDGAGKSATDVLGAPLLIARSLDAEFQEVEEASTAI